jgi:3-phenylpropionate/trans-cinnamate dioxygenase ferredoxin reductase subunit
MFADEPYPLYNRIALPPLLRKQVAEAKVIIRDAAWHEKHAIDLRLGTRVEAIDHEGKTVTAAGKQWPFDALLIATGGRPNPSDAPGSAGAHNIFNFQYMDDTKAISETLETAKTAVSVGGSFIAYELAEAFVSRGVQTHWLIRGPRFLRRMLDEISGELLDEAARADGCIIHYNDEVQSFARSNGVVTKVITKLGTEIDADVVGIGLGLTINTELVHGTPIEVGTGIKCDDRLETAVKGIYAAGDAAEFFDPIADMHYRMGTWNNAGAHGKVAAANMAGGDVRYHDVPEYSSKIFSEQTITQFGLSPEYRDDLTMVRSIEPEKKWYRALWFREEQLVGGLLIGKGNRAGKRRYLDAIKTKAQFPKAEHESLLHWLADT